MKISELQVLKSGAGFYIGRTCEDPDYPGLQEPYSRESGYYRTREAAEADLGSFEVRICVENELAYSQGMIPRPQR